MTPENGTLVRLEALEDRMNKVEASMLDRDRRCERHTSTQTQCWGEIHSRITQLAVDIAMIKGRMIGYLCAATVIGGVVLFLAQVLLGHVGAK